MKSLLSMNSSDITFNKAVEEVEEATKAAKETVNRPQMETEKSTITKVRAHYQNQSTTKSKCLKCGFKYHPTRECTKQNLYCKFCQKEGHLETVCFKDATFARRKDILNRNASSKETNRKSQSEFLLLLITYFTTSLKQDIQINNKGTFKFLVGSGSRDSFCSKNFWGELGSPKLSVNKINFQAATGNKVMVQGCFRAQIKLKGSQNETPVELNVVDVSELNLLGRKAIKVLSIDVNELIQGVMAISNSSNNISLKDMCKQFRIWGSFQTRIRMFERR